MSAQVREAIKEMAKYYGKGNLSELMRNRARLMKSSIESSVPREFEFPVVAGIFSIHRLIFIRSEIFKRSFLMVLGLPGL